MTDLADFTALVGRDHGLGVVSTLRPDGTIQSSVVNVGVLPHPVTGEQVAEPAGSALADEGDHLLAGDRVREYANVHD